MLNIIKGFVDFLLFLFLVAILTGVLQVVKGPYWGNFMAWFN